MRRFSTLLIGGLLVAACGGGEEAITRLAKRGKMPIRDRIAAVLDRDSPFLEISPLAAWRSPRRSGPRSPQVPASARTMAGPGCS